MHILFDYVEGTSCTVNPYVDCYYINDDILKGVQYYVPVLCLAAGTITILATFTEYSDHLESRNQQHCLEPNLYRRSNHSGYILGLNSISMLITFVALWVTHALFA